MQFSRKVLTRLLVGMLTVLVPLAAVAAEEVARATYSSTGIEWMVLVDHDQATLSVISPWGDTVTRTFPAGKNPFISAKELEDDGVYAFDLVITPRVSDDVKKRLAAAHAAGDDGRKLQRQLGVAPTVSVSGHFTRRDGAIVSRDEKEETDRDGQAAGQTAASATGNGTSASNRPGKIAVNDFVINDDLIVIGSTCTGFDCVNGEVFNFDTFRLKENNLRIHFEDTSVGTFPTNDWRLIANDSASGGASKFSVEDSTGAKTPFTIEAGASTNSVFVDSTGRVGFRTSTPVLDLHVNTSNTPAMRLEQNNSGGFTAQTWDIAGNEANFFIRDVTGGSRLPFRIRPGAPTSSIDIAAVGNVGVGGVSGNYKLDVQVGTTDGVRFFNNSTSDSGIEFLPSNTIENRILSFDRATATHHKLLIQASPGGGFTLDTNGNIGIGVPSPTFQIHHSSGARLDAGSWVNASSRELKQDIHELDAQEALCALDELNPVTFAYKSNPNEQQVGFIAEDVPSLVATSDRGGLASMDVVAVLTKVVKEQQKAMEDQQKTIHSLQQRLEKIENKQ